ncbi:hypothetical protein BKA70DRAFT_1379523 [Coprinopsis sp. MPI-PUGE-AT-0042]|nr:hypothetical protein BKA70DRAFT_1379523 [Coprinopsis sp. MPI-PUGE-AT-0042]
MPVNSSVSTMINELEGQKSGQSVKAIRVRPKGKEVRLRGNLICKHVGFSARTTIMGRSSIVMDLMFSEWVTPYDIIYLQELVRNGPTTYPGARAVVQDTGERIDLRYHKGTGGLLRYGWVVERHLKEREPFSYLLFNRQLPFRKMVRLMPYSTFRLNLSIIPPYNADFEGEERNMQYIVSPQANKPGMSIIQDTLCVIPFVQNIPIWVPHWDGTIPTPAIIEHTPRWTGKQIPSHDHPSWDQSRASLELEKANPVFDVSMLIGNGEMKAVGAAAGGLGHEVAKRLFTGLQMIVNSWLFHNSLVSAIGDSIADGSEPIPEANGGVAGVIDRQNDRPICTKHLKEGNNVKQMVVAVSKGSFINISQMSVCIGKQSADLSHFVENSYLQALVPREFFRAMAACEGLIDTAVKTAVLENVTVCYDSTVRNSLGDNIDAFALNKKSFDHTYRVDIIDNDSRFLPGTLQLGIDNSSLERQGKLDEEHTNVDFYLPINLYRLIQNTTQIYHIDLRKPVDLPPARIDDADHGLGECLVEAQDNLMFRVHLRVAFPARNVL